MRLFKDADVFTEYLNKSNSTMGRIGHILANTSGAIVLNDKLADQLSTIERVFKDKVVAQALAAVRNGTIVLVTIPPKYNLPECIPFIKYKKDNSEKVLINLTRFINESKNEDKEIMYSIDVQKLYVYIYCAYLNLTAFTDKAELPPDAIRIAADLWARMFTKVLNRSIGLMTNRDRYEAFVWFAAKFFCAYYLELDETRAGKVAELVVKRNMLVDMMEDQINSLHLRPFDNFESFCKAIFNNEVSNIKSLRHDNTTEPLGFGSYISDFVNMYNFAALGALVSFPFFFFVIFSAYRKTHIVNNRSVDDLFEPTSIVQKMITAIERNMG